MNRKHGITLITLFFALMLLTPLTYASDNEKMYSVTITNITKGQLFTPILVATHKAGHPVFTLGSAASEELTAIAEGGATDGLKDKLMNSGMGFDAVSSGAPLLPGESVTVKVKSMNKFNYISLAAMLLPTNDGFIAINGMRLPKKIKTMVIPGYDAGSEINDELCANIPGPHCDGSPFSMEDGEGFVHIHNGIRGVGDLSAADHDWKNPVATVKIKRMK